MSPVIREIQFKTTMKYHFTHSRIAKIKKTTSINKEVENLETHTLLV